MNHPKLINKDKAMTNINSYHKTLALINNQDRNKAMIDSFLGTSSFQKTLDWVKSQDHNKTMVDGLLGASSMHKTLALISRTDIFEQLILNNSLKEMMLSLSDVASSQYHWDESVLDSADNAIDSREVSSEIKKLGNSKTSSEFLECLLKLPYFIQKIILILFTLILIPIANDIAANLITPFVEEFIGISDKPKKELVKDISKIHLANVELEQYRFVSVDNLMLRESSNSKSAILDNLQFGQVVTVLTKEKNWIEVTYTYSEGETMRGWVFARYITKFKYKPC